MTKRKDGQKCQIHTLTDNGSRLTFDLQLHLGSERVSETEDEEEILTWFTGSQRVK